MRKKVIYWMLALLVISSTSMNAQVMIGSLDDPHTGAALEVKSATKGLLLPRIPLSNVNVFQLDVTTSDTAEDAMGMIVFNTNASLSDGIGVYVWTGTRWSKIVNTGQAVTSVSSITISGENIGYLPYGILSFSANVLPLNATIRDVTWSVSNGTGIATINPVTGQLQAQKEGTVSVVATALDGSGTVSQPYMVTISTAKDIITGGVYVLTNGSYFTGVTSGSDVVDIFPYFTFLNKTLYIAYTDTDYPTDLASAVSACASYGNGWRLPTLGEIGSFISGSVIPNLMSKPSDINNNYWSSTEYDGDSAWTFDSLLHSVSASNKSEEANVRCVWNVPVP